MASRLRTGCSRTSPRARRPCDDPIRSRHGRRVPGTMSDEHRARGVLYDPAPDAARVEVRESRVTAAAQDDQVGRPLGRRLHHAVRQVTLANVDLSLPAGGPQPSGRLVRPDGGGFARMLERPLRRLGIRLHGAVPARREAGGRRGLPGGLHARSLPLRRRWLPRLCTSKRRSARDHAPATRTDRRQMIPSSDVFGRVEHKSVASSEPIGAMRKYVDTPSI